jgi:hypothetical protein
MKPLVLPLAETTDGLPLWRVGEIAKGHAQTAGGQEVRHTPVARFAVDVAEVVLICIEGRLPSSVTRFEEFVERLRAVGEMTCIAVLQGAHGSPGRFRPIARIVSTHRRRAVGWATSRRPAGTPSPCVRPGGTVDGRLAVSVERGRRIDAVDLDGGVEGELLPTAPRSTARRGPRGKAEVFEDLARGALVLDRGEDGHPVATARTREGVDAPAPAE